MASPQKKNGYTPIANELLEAIIKMPFTVYQQKIVLAIARETYGWSRLKAQMSYGLFSKLTNIKRTNAIRTINQLEKMNVIFKQKSRGDLKSQIFGINKNYEEWGVEKPVEKPVENSQIVSPERLNSLCTETTNSLSAETRNSLHPETTSKQENNKTRFKKELSKKPDSSKFLNFGYVKSLLKQLNDKHAVKDHLLNRGFTEHQIENAFEAINNYKKASK